MIGWVENKWLGKVFVVKTYGEACGVRKEGKYWVGEGHWGQEGECRKCGRGRKINMSAI